MTIVDFLTHLERIYLPKTSPAVCATVAEEIRDRFAAGARILRGRIPSRLPARTMRVSVGRPPRGLRSPEAWVHFHTDRGPSARLAASDARYLYAFFSRLVEVRGDDPLDRYRRKRLLAPAFLGQRPVWDLYYAQAARTIRGMDRDAYVRQMARYGFTHLEVNSLAFPEGLEEGVSGEVYPRFYTYCPALDQFVDSTLNRGDYPRTYLAANLMLLKENCRLADRYGLVPTMTCFEPRSVPDALLDRYPELRGCRVDHPLRSFKPRYNLAVSHPVVRRHYRELVRNLLREVPALGCLSVWSNDSGAGFEFTRSLYAGANGSAYLVREWSEEDVFTGAAAANVVGFLRLLLDSAREVNPDFRVATRLEPFGPEREAILAGLGDGLDVEAPTWLATGWESPYGHPTYPDSEIGPLTIYNHDFLPEEKPPIRRFAARGGRTHVMYAHGPVGNFEPLLGIPSPWLTYEKLRALHRVGADRLAHVGGVAPPSAVPYNVNEEIFRRFQFDPGLHVEDAVHEIAGAFAGSENAPDLVRVWRLVEKAIRGFMPNPLYFMWGVWYRIWTRPLIPDLEAIPEPERAYYEDQILSTHHNPNRVDLSRDVLFTLMTPEQAEQAVQRIDERALPFLTEAGQFTKNSPATVPHLATHPGEFLVNCPASVAVDLRDRTGALRCWMTTRRNVAAWIANVHGYLDTKDRAKRAACRRNLREMVDLEIENTRRLLDLWDHSETEFMAVSKLQETTFIHGEDFGRHLERKISLMEKYGSVEPRIDEEILWRVRGKP